MQKTTTWKCHGFKLSQGAGVRKRPQFPVNLTPPGLCANHSRSSAPFVLIGVVSMSSHPRRLIVGITGASGAIYGVRLLRLLQNTGVETHLVMSRSAKITLTQEMDIGVAEASALAS